ncbi:MAG TPA: YggS family pyridoxal phosphate-dependent enzyme [Pirellulales bacterium]|nr:YggS family pyridoxal phosphate-dependent enzyme [Pirellulales bacterium]
MVFLADRIADNLRVVLGRMAEAARRGGRSADDVRLVAVTKYVGPGEALALVAAGCHDLGESRPQQLWRKAAALKTAGVAWHLIGHLQRNKVARTLPLVSLVHSGDSLRLLEALDAEVACAKGDPLPVLLEVNVSGDAAKHGLAPGELEPLADSLARLPRIEIQGLMAMAGREGNLDDARREFAALRQLRDELRAAWAGRWPLDELSMGMSGDYEVAIEEGATLVRVGSALFQGLE